jgi:hypothetical protein
MISCNLGKLEPLILKEHINIVKLPKDWNEP